MDHYLNLHNNDSLLRELGKKIHTSGRNLDGSISNEERIMRNQALIFKNKASIKEEVIFKDEIGRIRDIQVNPNNGKIYFLAGDSLWLMEKN